MLHRTTTALGCLAAGLLIGAAASTANAQVTYETYVLSGEAAPGLGPGVSFRGFDLPVLNNAGDIAFVSSLVGTGIDGTNDRGIWARSNGGVLGLVARAGDHAVGTTGDVNFISFGTPLLNGNGDVVFLTSLIGADVDTTTNGGIWLRSNGALNLVARKGDHAAGTTGDVNFLSVGESVLNNSGEIAFSSSLVGADVDSTNNIGIWLHSNGVLSLVARKGSHAAGTTGDANFSILAAPVLNGVGDVVFWGALAGADVDSSNDGGVWAQSKGTLRLVVREGDHAAGTTGDVNFAGFGIPALSSDGDVAFSGVLTGADVHATNNSGIWAQSDGVLALVARKGDHATGATGDVNFLGFANPLLNKSGDTVFSVSLTGTDVDAASNNGIWLQSDGVLGMVAREGSQAAGTVGDVKFASFRAPALNSNGDTAFWASLTGADVDHTNDTGIWARGADGVLQLIVREGDAFDVDDNPLVEDMRTISLINLIHHSGSEDGRRMILNDNGQIAFRLYFKDGTNGIFAASIPEPTSLAMLGLGGLLLIRRRRSGV